METEYKSFKGIQQSFEKHPFWGSVIVVGILVVLVSMFSGSGSSDSQSPTYAANAPASICDTDAQTLQQAQKVNYKQLDKDPNSFSGTIATFTGQIVQIEQSGNEGIVRLSVTKESYGWSLSDIIYVTYHQATNAVDGDVVTVTGTLTGSQTYTSQANFQITIPSIDVCSVQMGAAKPTPAAPVKKTTTSAPVQSAPQTYTTPSGAVINGNGATVSTPPAPPASWHTAYTYNAAVDTKTPSFALQGAQQKITYTCSAVDSSQSMSWFNGRISSTSGGPGDTFAWTVNCPTSNSTYEYSLSPGQYYLDLSVFNGSYNATVEDYY